MPVLALRAGSIVAPLALLAAFTGCATHRALRNNTVKQAETVTDIHQQQVLDNLAKFVRDPYAMPSFAYAESGTAELTDNGKGTFGLSWDGTAFTGASLGGDGSRNVKETWATTPVTDPRKLELMRCAYQRVVAACGRGCESVACPDCRKRFNKFYTGRAYRTDYREDGSVCYACEGGELSNLVPAPTDDARVCSERGCGPPCVVEDGLQEACGCDPTPAEAECDACQRSACPSPGDGAVNSVCLHSTCWFGWGCKKCVPKHCTMVGHHEGTYVWVRPGPGSNELAKLTLAILDYAVHEERQLPTKEVTAYLCADGSLANPATASFVVKSTIGLEEPSHAVVSSDTTLRSTGACASTEAEKAILDAELAQLRLFGTELMSLRDKRGLDDASQEQIKSSINTLNTLIDRYETARKEVRDRRVAAQSEANRRIRMLPPVRPLPQQRTPTPNGGLLLLQQQLNRLN